MRVRRALISVSDKTGLEELARGLSELGVTIVSTGGTATALRDMGLEVVPVDEVTGHPEIMGGRVKTLHPRVHGGILARPDHEGDAADMRERRHRADRPRGGQPLPLRGDRGAARGVGEAEIVEQIDIGGPAMIRAAAKNHAHVGVVTSPDQYAAVLERAARRRRAVARAAPPPGGRRLPAHRRLRRGDRRLVRRDARTTSPTADRRASSDSAS